MAFLNRNPTFGEPCGLTYCELQKLPDDDLMEHLRLSHDDALTVLFDRYHRIVLRIALKILRDSGEAEDLVQDVFLNLHQTVAKFEPARGSTKGWIIQMAYRRSYNRRQYLTTRAFYNSDEMDELRENVALASALPAPESRYLAAQILDQVKGPQQIALQLICLQGLTVEEVANKMGESVGNVRHHYYRGLARLRILVTERARKTEMSTAHQEALDAKS